MLILFQNFAVVENTRGRFQNRVDKRLCEAKTDQSERSSRFERELICQSRSQPLVDPSLKTSLNLGGKMNIFWGELIGTMLLILLGNGVVANVLLNKSKGHNSGWIVISAGWGFAVGVAVYATGWASGGHINPAVTLGFCLAGKTAWSLFPIYVCSQMLGAIIRGSVSWLSYFPHWRATYDSTNKLLCFATHPAIRNLKWNFVNEVIGTAVLLIGVLGIFDIHNHISGGMGPYAVRDLGVQHRIISRWTHRVCHQSCPRFGPAHRPFLSSFFDAREFRMGLFLGAGVWTTARQLSWDSGLPISHCATQGDLMPLRVITQKGDVLPIHSPKDFETIFNVGYLPTLGFKEQKTQEKIEKRCAKAFRKGWITPRQKWLGHYYSQEIHGQLPLDLTIQWIDEQIGYGVWTNAEIPAQTYIGEYTGVLRRRLFFGRWKNLYCFDYNIGEGRNSGYVIDAQEFWQPCAFHQP